MKFAILLTFIYITGFLFSRSFASERIITKSIDKMAQFVTEIKQELGVENILVVYDFDNTLMAMNQDIGSDQWYTWQLNLIQDQKKSKDAVAKTKSELFDLHYKISAIGKMHLVENQTPKVVKEIQQMKIKSIVLTSRGPNLRNNLEKELDEADLDFKASAIGPEGGYPSTFLLEGVANPRRISYMDGIVMGSGQNKGVILKALLKRTNSKFKMVVFLDDTLKNIENMENELRDDFDLRTFYYTHEEDRVTNFKKDKSKARREWRVLKPALKSVFGS